MKTDIFHIISMKTDIFPKETGGRLKYVCFLLFSMGNYEVITLLRTFGNIENFFFKESEWSVKVMIFQVISSREICI